VLPDGIVNRGGQIVELGSLRNHPTAGCRGVALVRMKVSMLVRNMLSYEGAV